MVQTREVTQLSLAQAVHPHNYELKNMVVVLSHWFGVVCSVALSNQFCEPTRVAKRRGSRNNPLHSYNEFIIYFRSLSCLSSHLILIGKF